MGYDFDACDRLCLLTRAAWEDGLPPPLTRPMMHALLCGTEPDHTLRMRAEALLSRRMRVMDCIRAYENDGYEILLPRDERWPHRLHALGRHMPQFLFAKGNMEILDHCIIAAAGSREVSVHTASIARHLGQRLAAEGMALVSGGAQGVDHAAERGALEVGGSLVLVPAQTVSRLLSQNIFKQALEAGKLLILCDTLPDDAFSAQKALERNHTIYALGEAAVVVAARSGMGGSWRGAIDCLNGGYTPVFVPVGSSADMDGNDDLLSRGAQEIDLLAPLSAQLFAREQLRMQMEF